MSGMSGMGCLILRFLGQRNWTLCGLSGRAVQPRFPQCNGSMGILEMKLFTPYQHQNFRLDKPSAFGQVKEIVYLKENSENYS